jgi:hypothetical protein
VAQPIPHPFIAQVIGRDLGIEQQLLVVLTAAAPRST